MKLSANVEVRNIFLESTSGRQKHKSSKSWLSIGKKSVDNGEALLMICTRSNKHGTYYKVRDNVVRIFDTYTHEGRCTIRVREPPHDILIDKADRSQLILFLNSLRTYMKYEQPGMLPLLAPLSSSDISSSCHKKMLITSRKDYPIITNFPHTLENLTINNISLKTIDKRLFKLKHLQYLDLSHNKIELLPDTWENDGKLVELNLSHNQISMLPVGMVDGLRHLVSLNLNHNRITNLPSKIWNLTKLTTLKLSHNLLKTIPFGISKLRQLSLLDLSDNQLFMYPGDICKLSMLTSIDVSNNLDHNSGQVEDAFTNVNALMAFKSSSNLSVMYNVEELCTAPKLVELAARSIKNHKIPYTINDVGHMLPYLDGDAHECGTCGHWCHQNTGTIIKRMPLNYVSSTVIGSKVVWCQFFVCSVKCFQVLGR